VLGHSRIFQYITAAAPGLTEVVTIGKVWELAQLERRSPGAAPYDLVVLDAPATGGGLALLSAPRTYKAIAKVGPVGRHAAIIDSFLSDPRRTAVVAVALPEEMPINETIDLEARLANELGIELARVYVNGMLPERLSAGEAKTIAALDGAGSSAAREALGAALGGRARASAQRSQLRRLRRGVKATVATLPFVLSPELAQEDLKRLSAELERTL
jgi:anion-transporting  ArsA/GET3 family ATPase